MVKFSFFLPAIKATYLDQAIQSIVRQHYDYWNLVIVNDASPDDINSIVKPYLSDPRITFIENDKNRGEKDLVGFWNSFIPLLTGTFIIFASDDDVYEPDYLREMSRLIDSYPSCDLFHCRTRFIDQQGQIVQLVSPALEFESHVDFVYQKLFWKRKMTLQEFCFKKNALIDAGGLVCFPLAWYSDWATAFLLSRNGVACSKECLFNFRVSESNISRQEKNCLQKAEAMKRFIVWLEGFLPRMVCKSQEDEIMKKILLSSYKSIIYSHYHIYLPFLHIRDFFREMRFIRTHHVFAFKTRLSMTLRHFIHR